jgi:hypothetical protein
MGRGIDRQLISGGDRDRDDYVTRLAKLAGTGAFAIYAWALLWVECFCGSGRALARELGR